jgi:hypothetical protein
MTTTIFLESRAPKRAHAARSRRSSLGPRLLLLPLVLGMSSWAISLTQVNLANLGNFGLLPIMNGWFYAAFALLLLGFFAELMSSARGWVMGLYLAAVIVAIHAVVPILFHVPEYAWVYKHIGVIANLQAHGRVTDPSDLYQEWPALFAAVATITGVSRDSALQFAAWAPLAFELAETLVVVAIFRTMTSDRRVPYLAALLFQCAVTWVGQDYLSPQAFAFLLWLGIMLVVLRFLAPGAQAALAGSEQRGWRLTAIQSRLTADGTYPEPPPTWLRRAAVVLVLVMFSVIVVAHQLTPVIVLTSLIGLTVVGVLRPRWLVVVMAAIMVGFLYSRWTLITTQYGGFFGGGDVVSNASGTVQTFGSTAQEYTAKAVRVLAAAMWLSTAAFAATYWRRPGRVVVPVVLAFAPFCVIFASSYGGEAIYRVFLFSAPWCAYIVAMSMMRVKRSWMTKAFLAVIPFALLASMQGLFGPLAVDGFTSAEIQSSLYFYGHAAVGSTLITGDENLPVQEAANSNDFSVVAPPSDPEYGPAWLNLSSQRAFDKWVSQTAGGHPIYLAISTSMEAYARYYGNPIGYDKLRGHVLADKRWTLWFRNADVDIYRFGSR